MSSIVLNRARILLLQIFTVFFIFGLSSAYITSIHVPAVLGNTNTGVISNIQLNITPGSGAVTIKGPKSVGQSTLLSAQTGVAYATNFTGVNESRYNFTYTILDNLSNVTGPSGGLAFTLLAISGIRQVPLNQDFTLTGTISNNGQVGEIGGITDKVSAAKAFGLSYVLAPAVQNQSFEDLLYYLSQQINNIPVIEVSNVSSAIKYAFTNNTAVISKLNYNATSSKYPLSELANAPFSCNETCNTSYFNNLVNYTFNITSQEINSISNNFSSIKPQLQNSLSQYEQISSKGYLYAGADLSFLEYINAYVFANTDNFTLNNAYALLNKVSNYCNSLTPPQLTPQNYEYVVSGEARQSWALQNLNIASNTLNQSQSTDDIVIAVSTIGESSAWCAATSELYSQAQALPSNGTYFTLSTQIKSLAKRTLQQDTTYNGSMYYNAAVESYNTGEYGSALYSLYYLSSVNGNNGYPSNYSEAMLYKELNSTLYGIWPVEYANSAAFYAEEAGLSSNKDLATGYLASSYPLALLAGKISYLDRILSSNLTISNSSQIISNNNSTISSSSYLQLFGLLGEEAQSIKDLQGTVSTLKLVIELILVMVVVFLIALLYFISKEFALRKKILISKKRVERRHK